MTYQAIVVGGGLAGSEAAWQLAERGIDVRLFEMRPKRSTGAHVSDRLGELVCSNSLGSRLRDRATGLLQHELKMLGSKLLDCANQSAVPAGGALAVDREQFAQLVTESIERHPRITVIRDEITSIPRQPSVIATGPLTSPALSEEIRQLAGEEHLYFYDAIAPIVTLDSIDFSVAFYGNRYDKEANDDNGDYINCPMSEEEYRRFVAAIQQAETITLRDFERDDPHFFEGCIPIEQLARRGSDTLAYGPMRPVGLRDPRTGQRPYAVVQLRQDNLAGSLYNIVGFQTNIRWGQQKEILRMIPGLSNAEFVRLGQMHRNTFMNSPVLLNSSMQFRTIENLFFAGQITGVEGYTGNIATGLLAGINLANRLLGLPSLILPKTTMLGALCHYITHTDPSNFQPIKANFGILPELLPPVKVKRQRYGAFAERALNDLKEYIIESNDPIFQEAY